MSPPYLTARFTLTIDRPRERQRHCWAPDPPAPDLWARTFPRIGQRFAPPYRPARVVRWINIRAAALRRRIERAMVAKMAADLDRYILGKSAPACAPTMHEV